MTDKKRESNRAWAEANKERLRAYRKEWRERNADKIREYAMKYKDKSKELTREWFKAHPEYAHEYYLMRKEIKRQERLDALQAASGDQKVKP